MQRVIRWPDSALRLTVGGDLTPLGLVGWGLDAGSDRREAPPRSQRSRAASVNNRGTGEAVVRSRDVEVLGPIVGPDAVHGPVHLARLEPPAFLRERVERDRAVGASKERLWPEVGMDHDGDADRVRAD